MSNKQKKLRLTVHLIFLIDCLCTLASFYLVSSTTEPILVNLLINTCLFNAVVSQRRKKVLCVDTIEFPFFGFSCNSYFNFRVIGLRGYFFR